MAAIRTCASTARVRRRAGSSGLCARRALTKTSIGSSCVCTRSRCLRRTTFNGADLGIRMEWLPLFDRYGVDLVVTGHEHHFERTLAVRGVDADSPTLRPKVADSRLDV